MTRIPNSVLEYMAGAEIYPDSQTFEKCSAEHQARAVEDALYLLEVCGDGYHGNPARIQKTCRTFIQKAKLAGTGNDGSPEAKTVPEPRK